MLGSNSAGHAGPAVAVPAVASEADGPQVIEDLVDGANIDGGGLDLCIEECAPTNLVAEAVAAAKVLLSESLLPARSGP